MNGHVSYLGRGAARSRAEACGAASAAASGAAPAEEMEALLTCVLGPGAPLPAPAALLAPFFASAAAGAPLCERAVSMRPCYYVRGTVAFAFTNRISIVYDPLVDEALMNLFGIY